MGGPPALVSDRGVILLKEKVSRNSFLPLLQFEAFAPLSLPRELGPHGPYESRRGLLLQLFSHAGTQPDLAVVSWLVFRLSLLLVRLFLPPQPLSPSVDLQDPEQMPPP